MTDKSLMVQPGSISNGDGMDRPRFLLVIESDLSLTTGYSINERESTTALLDQFPEQIRVISPEPSFPDQFADPRIDYVRSHRRHHPFHYFRFVIELRRAIARISAEHRPAAVIFRLGPLPIVPALLVRDEQPVILKKLAGFAMFAGESRPTRMRLIQWPAERLYRYVAGRCIGADVESYGYMEWLPATLDVPPEKLQLIPNAANTKFFAPMDRFEARLKHGWQRFDRLIGYVGAMDNLRCVDIAVQAAVELRDDPGLGFVFVGKGPHLAALKEAVASEGLADRILFPGFVPYSDVPSVINALDVALDLTLVPFRVGQRTIIGSYSQKIAQYLACGVPVVAWKSEDTQFLDDHQIGATVAPGSMDELTRVLRYTVGRKDIDAVRNRARAYACEELSADVIARRRMEFWEGLAIDRRHRTPGIERVDR